MKIVPFFLAGLALAGCATPPPKVEEPETRCQLIGKVLAHDRINIGTKLAALEMGRNEGCFGQPPPAKADVTIRRQ